MIQNTSCRDIQAWFIANPTIWEELQSDSELVEHVSGCPACRARLMLQLQDLLQVPFELEEGEETGCPEELLSYIDLEQEQGTVAAIKAFPRVWWHLWQCEQCSESYQDVASLIQEHGDLFADLVPKSKPSKHGACCPEEAINAAEQNS